MSTLSWSDAIVGLERGDFSRLEPLFVDREDGRCQIVEWCVAGKFIDEAVALAEALSCACFLGRTQVVAYLLDRHVDPIAGNSTGPTGVHWAANRGQLETVKLLVERRVSLEHQNMYGGTVLGCAVWSAIHEPRPDHLAIIELLLAAGARRDAVTLPTGDERIDRLLRGTA